jgi:hypothetical protein
MPPLVSSSSSDDPPGRKPPGAESSSIDVPSISSSEDEKSPPRTCHHHRLHSVPYQGGAGDLRRRSRIHHPLTRSGNPILLHPNVEERRPHMRLWDQTPGLTSRVVSDLMEMTEEAEDEEAITGEGGANWCGC